jgi:FtsZ-binding cell division protein ZapB
LTTELERIKILESKISHVIEFINKLMGENEKLKQQVKELKAEKKSFEEQAQKLGKLDEDLKVYQKEREAMKGKIEAIISQIDRIEI